MSAQDSIDKVVAEMLGIPQSHAIVKRHAVISWANRLSALRVVPEWLPISSAPKDGTRVAIKFGSGFECEANWQTTYGGEWHVDSLHHLPWSDQHLISHWQPLPPPPAGEKE